MSTMADIAVFAEPGVAVFSMAALLMAVSFLLCVFQTIRVCREATDGQHAFIVVLADAGILLHLILLALCLRCFEAGASTMIMPDGEMLSVADFFWADILVAALVCASAVSSRQWADALVVCSLIALLPCFWPVYSSYSLLVCGIDCVVIAARVALPYASGRSWGGLGMHAASPSEALNLLPHGVLCARPGGQIVFMNDVMRAILTQTGNKGDLGDARDLFQELQGRRNGMQLAVSLNDGRVFHVSSKNDAGMRSEGLYYIVAWDVTAEEKINRELAQANEQRQRQNDEISRLLRNILYASHQEAALQMRGAVHDIVGQRLSILHRHLEDDDLDDATLAQIRESLVSLLDDLRPAEDVPPEATLEAMVNTFGLAGLEGVVDGSLSPDEETARLQLRVFREAVTNALRHGNARRVWVTLGEEGDEVFVRVENDGEWSTAAIIEGNGLRGLRKAVEDQGGTLKLDPAAPRFSLEARVPVRADSARKVEAGSASAAPAAAREGDTFHVLATATHGEDAPATPAAGVHEGAES